MQKINKEFDRLFFLGDTHGNNMQIAGHLIKNKAERFESKAIVHVGDFGIGFENTLDEEYRKLDKLNTRLMEHNVTLYVVRGNHDDPSWFDGTPFTVSGNIIFVQDHTLLTIKLKDKGEPVKIYCNGGATSIDRTNRNDSRNNIQHYFGHFHWSHKERIGDIAHITLAIAEIAEFRYASEPVDQYNGKTRTGGLSPDTGPRA